ncbi:adenylosuccinate lyase [Buchnera aphidicola (Mindarus keteleerifoliae)]|uniref:adenylosuccinate lyase n=1 Tax=Buchnera aphidicola TaxID=9 RepID=UPI0031B6A577
MKLNDLMAISPIDGRYCKQTLLLKEIFSEYAFLKFRVKVEINWLKKLSSINELKELPLFDKKTTEILNEIYEKFNKEDAYQIKKIEKKIKHDTKAIEYFLKKKISKIKKLDSIIEFIHFSCTSEDINNLSYALMLKTFIKISLLPNWEKIISLLKKLSFSSKNQVMLSRTHGQPATPTTMGKEIANFIFRLNRQLNQIKKIEILGKMNGTVGNYNANLVAYPNIDWIKVSREFVNQLGIEWNPYTTQIEPHDYISELFSCISRFNLILIDLARDIWGYISLGYFSQKKILKEIGSSIMPYKINPINFENAEGNLGLSNAIMNFIGEKLPVSRWQRDLSDSTVLRNLGVALGYSIVSYTSIQTGIQKIKINKKVVEKDLNNHWEILTEAMQTILRRYGIKNSYEKLKKEIEKNKINSKNIIYIIEKLPIPEKEKNKLKTLTPNKYVGLSIELNDRIF